MARRNLASRAFYALSHLATVTWALKLPRLALPTPLIALDVASPAVTAAPSPVAVELRFQRRADDLRCASSCVSAAVTKSTNCRVDDNSCRCQVPNARKILVGAEVCILAACGLAEYAAAVSRFQGYCLTASGVGVTGITDELPTQGTVVVTNSVGNGAPVVSTIIIGPVGTTPATSATSASETSTASSSQSSGSSGSISSGAIAGIAVGTAGGAIFLCAALFLIYRRKRLGAGKKTEDAAAAAAAAATTAASHPPAAGTTTVAAGAAAAPFKQELDGQEAKPGLYADATSPAPTNVSSDAQGFPGLTPSPMTMAGQPVSPSSPPPVYPGGWQQPFSPPGQQPQVVYASGAAAQHVHEVPGGREVPSLNVQEVHGASAAMEMTGDTRLPQEMPDGGHAVYEMPSMSYTR